MLKEKLYIRAAVCLLLVSILLPNFAWAASFSFSRNLRLGSVGQDVQELQKLLNSDVRTKVSELGAGSAGNETQTFGKLTENALKNFQSIYSKEVLAPAGLNQPNGFFGPLTRSKANYILAGFNSNYQTVPSTVSTSTQSNSSAATPISPLVTTPTSSPVVLSTVPDRPNDINTFMKYVDDQARRNGISEQRIEEINQYILANKDNKDISGPQVFFNQYNKDVQDKKNISFKSNLNIQASLDKNKINPIVSNISQSKNNYTTLLSSSNTSFLKPEFAAKFKIDQQKITVPSSISKSKITPQPLAGSPTDLPFGNMVYYSYYCGCSANLIVLVIDLAGGYMSGLYTYQPGGTLLHLVYIPPLVESLWVFGHYSLTGIVSCVLAVPPPVYCYPLTGRGIMTEVGTALSE